MSDLSDDLQTIDGVGEATAEKILSVLEAHDTEPDPDPYLQKALDAAEAGDDRQAALYLRRYAGGE